MAQRAEEEEEEELHRGKSLQLFMFPDPSIKYCRLMFTSVFIYFNNHLFRSHPPGAHWDPYGPPPNNVGEPNPDELRPPSFDNDYFS